MKNNILLQKLKLRRASLLAFMPFVVLAPLAQADTFTVVSGSVDLTAPASYGGTLPGTSSDVVFGPGAYAPATFTVGPTSTGLSIGTLNDTSTTTALTINNVSGAVDTLTLNGGSNGVAPSAADLLYVKTGDTLTIGTNGTTSGTNALNVVLASSGNFDIVGSTTINSVISGSGFGFTKTGAGTLTLGGVNTFTGPVAVTGGTLAVTTTTALGAVPASFVANQLTLDSGILSPNIALTFAANQGITLGAGGGTITDTNNASGPTINSVITGSGSLTTNNIGGGRAVALNAANTYTGGTIINTGQITLGNSLGLGTGSVQMNNGSQLSLLTNGINVANAITVSAGATALVESNVGNSTDTESGAITLSSATSVLNLGNANGTSTLFITGGVTGTGNVLFGNSITSGRSTANVTVNTGSVNNIGTVTNASNAGTGSKETINSVIGSNVTGVIQNSALVPLVLGGANTYVGPTSIKSGTLMLTGAGTLGAATNTLDLTTTTPVAIVTPPTPATTSTLDLGGTSQNVGAFIGGTGSTVLNSTNGTTSTLTAGNGDASSTYGGVIENNAGGTATGVVAVAKTGAGTVALSGVNTYSGGTTVSQGVLQAGNASALGLGNVNVTGGTLQGTISPVNFAANLTLSGTGILQAAAVGTGKFTLTGSASAFALNGGTWDLAITGPGANDLINSTGGVGTSFTINGGVLSLAGDTLTVGQDYTILSGFGTGGGQFSSIVGYDSSTFNVSFDDTSTAGVGILVVAAVPEPSTWALLFGSLAVLLFGLAKKRSEKSDS